MAETPSTSDSSDADSRQNGAGVQAQPIDETLQYLQDVCACSAAEGARRLATCGGDLELAIQEFLNEQDGRRPLLDEAEQNELNRQTELRRRNPQASSSSNDSAGPSAAALRRLGPRDASQPLGWIRWTVSLLLLPFHFAYSTFYDTCRFIYGLLFGTQGGQRAVENAEADVRSFWEEFEQKFGVDHPDARVTSYSAALDHAKKELKFLLVYLHSRTHPESERFCREVIAHPDFIQFVGRNAVFWACAVHTREGYRVSAALRETRYPALGLVCMREGRMALVMRLQGCHPVGDVVGALALALNDNDAHMVAARLEREQQLMDQALRREQEEAYEAAQTEERRREEQRRDDEQLERRRLDDEHRQALHAQQRDQELAERRKEVAASLPAEPDESAACVRVSLKFPNGSRVERRFSPDDSLQVLHDVAFAQEGVCPRSFRLLCSYPRRELVCAATDGGAVPTLADAGLEKAVLVLVEDTSD